MQYKAIAQKLIALQNADLQLRDKLLQNGELNKGYNAEMEKVHNSNATQLNEIINKIGYPTIDKVGEAANEAAWLIIQHAIGRPEFMKKCGQLLEQAVIEKKANPINLAYLTDRIAVFEGNPQRFGTQFDWDENGQLSPQPFDDLSKVNQRRQAIGLNTLEEQTALIRRRANEEQETPPTDFAERKRAIEEWKKLVGWKK